MSSQYAGGAVNSFGMAPEALYAHLAHGLHAAAQPLTILLASLNEEHTKGMNTADLRELAASSAVEVRRVCNLFTGMQKIVLAGSLRPEVSLLSILPVLTRVAEELSPLFDKDGMSLRSQAPGSCPLVLMNRARTQQALAAVLLVARAHSHGHDTIELLATSSRQAVEIVIQNSNAFIPRLNVEADLSMALAETNIRSQRGSFSLSMQPFRVRIEFDHAGL
jgi:hypothetical protein